MAARRISSSRIFPVLTPQAIDPAHPFPFIPNQGCHRPCSGAIARREAADPRVLIAAGPARALRPPARRGGALRAIEEARADAASTGIFPGSEPARPRLFRVLRDSDIEIEEEAEDLVRYFRTAIKRRRRGRVIRLELETGMPDDLRSPAARASSAVGPTRSSSTRRASSASATSSAIWSTRTGPTCKFTPYHPALSRAHPRHGGDCFAAIRAKDIVVHHPYETLRGGARLPAAGGARPGRRRDQADALPRRQAIGGDQRADRPRPRRASR